MQINLKSIPDRRGRPPLPGEVDYQKCIDLLTETIEKETEAEHPHYDDEDLKYIVARCATYMIMSAYLQCFDPERWEKHKFREIDITDDDDFNIIASVLAGRK